MHIKPTDISQISSTSSVYYLQEVENGFHEIYFGDGNVSKPLSDGNIVILNYVVTNKTASNGASSFYAPSTIDGVSDITVTQYRDAGGGAEPESLASIKLQPPLDYASQGRAVTTDDYVTYTKKLFANTQLYLYGVEKMVGTIQLVLLLFQSMVKFSFLSEITTGQNLTDTGKHNS